MKSYQKMIAGSALLMLGACGEQAEQKNETKGSTPAFEISALDTTVAPCADFYDYTAGGFIENNPVPDDESRWGRFNILIEENNNKLKEILNNFADADDLQKGSHRQLVGDLFKSGMDTAQINETGIQGIKPVLDRIDQIEDLNAYFETTAYFKLIGVSNPFSVYVSPDKKNVDKNFLYLSQSGLSLPDRDYYLNDGDDYDEIREQFRAYIADMFAKIGSDRENAKKMAAKVYRIEHALAEKQMDKVDRRNPDLTYNKMELQSFIGRSPRVLWETYLGGTETETDSLIVSQPDYMKFLSRFYESTDIADLKTYMKWHLINSKANFLTEDLEKRRFEFYGKVLQGTKTMKPRWKRVMNRMGGLDEQMGRLFVEEHFSPESKKRVEQMVEDLRAAYRVRIKDLDWMTVETKEKALEKLQAFTYKIGYPDEWSDYSGLVIEPDAYFDNMMRLSEYKTRENLAKLHKPVDRDEWFMGAHVVNAYYSSSFNEIVFPAGILQPPFFNPDADDAINYGGIGGVIGHEFTHGFDDKGSLYGPDGNLGNWWTEKDREQFDELVDQIIAQYNQYEPIEGLNVNGALTVGENIADFGGITLAYHAYKKSREGKPELDPIDGFTDKQRVFLGWAQVWQTNATKEFIRNRVLTDPHSPARYRVNGPLSNMIEFKEAFNCDPESGFVKPEDEMIVIW